MPGPTTQITIHSDLKTDQLKTLEDHFGYALQETRKLTPEEREAIRAAIILAWPHNGEERCLLVATDDAWPDIAELFDKGVQGSFALMNEAEGER